MMRHIQLGNAYDTKNSSLYRIRKKYRHLMKGVNYV
jgi:hypothetical protein